MGSNPSIYLILFYFIKTISNYEDCFFSILVTIINFRRLQVGALWNKMQNFVESLYFKSFIINAKIILMVITIIINIIILIIILLPFPGSQKSFYFSPYFLSPA